MQDHKGDPNIKSRRLRRLKESSRERAYMYANVLFMSRFDRSNKSVKQLSFN